MLSWYVLPDDDSTDDDAPSRGPRKGRAPVRERAIANLAQAVRERVDPAILVDYHMAIMEGVDALIIPDDEGGHYIAAHPSGVGSTAEQRARSSEWLSNRGYGLPVQAIMLDAQVRAQLDTGPGLQLGTMTPENFALVMRGLGLALGPGAPSSVIDAESSEGEATPAQITPDRTLPEGQPSADSASREADSAPQGAASADQGATSDG